MNENYNFFMKEDVSAYVDQWIAVTDNKIVSHGKNAKQVFEEAKKNSPEKGILIAKIPGKETTII